ncbi:MAG: hypothetical protein JNK05_34450 [Myxococcales bacterium]|nr:hypothetical protein [Myxococcales bacterium]
MFNRSRSYRAACALLAVGAVSCAPAAVAVQVTVNEDAGELTATVGPAGGVIEAPSSAAFEGFALSVPAGALASSATVRVRRVEDHSPLPPDAIRVGVQFQLESSATPSQALQVRLPVDVAARHAFGGNAEDVKVWARTADGWTLIEPTSTSTNRVVIATTSFTTVAAGVRVRQTLTMAQLCGGAATCTNVQLFDPPIGRAPAPCSVMGGFCLEPLIGTTGNPAPRPNASGMLVGNGFVTYAERLPAGTNSPPRAMQLRTSDLALLHSARVPDLGARSRAAQIDTGGIFSGQAFHRFVGATNDPLPTTSLFTSGDAIGADWSPLSMNSARAYRRDGALVSHRDVTTGNERTAAATAPAPNIVTFLGSERGTAGGMWFVEAAQPFDMSLSGVRAGILRRVGTNGSITASINDLSPPVLLFFDVGSGGAGGFGQSGAASATSTPNVFYANARRLVVSGFTGANAPQPLYMADLTSATPTLAQLNIPNPMPGMSGAAFRSVVVDPSDKVWFVYGATFGMGLFVFDPANNSLQAVPLPEHGAVQVGFDGTHIIVFAQPTQGGPDRNIFRVRPFSA